MDTEKSSSTAAPDADGLTTKICREDDGSFSFLVFDPRNGRWVADLYRPSNGVSMYAMTQDWARAVQFRAKSEDEARQIVLSFRDHFGEAFESAYPPGAGGRIFLTSGTGGGGYMWRGAGSLPS